MEFKLGDVISKTMTRKSYLKHYVNLVEKFNKDPNKKERLEKHECVFCFYSDRVGAAAMTKKDCIYCGKTEMYGNSNTNDVCIECAKRYELCVHCGSDIKMRTRRKK